VADEAGMLVNCLFEARSRRSPCASRSSADNGFVKQRRGMVMGRVPLGMKTILSEAARRKASCPTTTPKCAIEFIDR
jgi:hypothetical protein